MISDEDVARLRHCCVRASICGTANVLVAARYAGYGLATVGLAAGYILKELSVNGMIIIIEKISAWSPVLAFECINKIQRPNRTAESHTNAPK